MANKKKKEDAWRGGELGGVARHVALQTMCPLSKSLCFVFFKSGDLVYAVSTFSIRQVKNTMRINAYMIPLPFSFPQTTTLIREISYKFY